MRYLGVLFATVIFAACSKVPIPRTESRAEGTARALATEAQKGPSDSVIQFLLTAAATDFHTHRPPDPVRFRNVRIGHLMTASGEAQYMLCGQFLPSQQDDKAGWIPFATIKTSDYEQWIGLQANAFCEGPSVEWDKIDDLSSTLQGRLDSLR